jgi:hypothetical protein
LIYGMTRHAYLLGALLLGACSASRGAAQSAAPARDIAGFSRFTSADGGFSVKMPAPVGERRVREGPMMASIIHAVDIDKTRYEVARFDMPEPLDEARRADLTAKVERGLTQSPGARVTGQRSVLVGGVPAVELLVDFPGGRHGQWWIFFAGKERMFQVSMLGPAGDRQTAGAALFFRSFDRKGKLPVDQ